MSRFQEPRRGGVRRLAICGAIFVCCGGTASLMTALSAHVHDPVVDDAVVVQRNVVGETRSIHPDSDDTSF